MTNRIIEGISELRKPFFPFFIYTKGYFESKFYQYRSINFRNYEQVKLALEDSEEIVIDFYDVVKKIEKKEKIIFGDKDTVINNVKNSEDVMNSEDVKNEELKITNDLLDDKPFKKIHNVVLVHGFNGSSSSSYIKNLSYELDQHRVFGFNARGALAELKTEKFFHIGFSDDLEHVVNYILNKYDGNIILIGFSMGSSWVTNYLSKNKSGRVIGGVGVCVPFNFVSIRDVLKGTWVSDLLAKEFKKYLSKHNIFKKYDYQKCTTVSEIDELLTIKVFDFINCEEYYNSQSIESKLDKIEVPMIFINTKDDPIIPVTTIPLSKIERNPNLILCILEAGGHLGLMNFLMRKSFVEIVVKDFLNVLNNEETKKIK